MNTVGNTLSFCFMLAAMALPPSVCGQTPGSGMDTQRAIPLPADATAQALTLRPGCLDLLGAAPDELTPFAVASAAPYWLGTSNDDCPKLALALGGGGSRAAPYAMGVLEGMLNTGLISHTQLISSVSGGGYAALWYYTELMRGDLVNESREQLTKRLQVSTQDMLSPIRCVLDDEHGHAFMTERVYAQTGCRALANASDADRVAKGEALGIPLKDVTSFRSASSFAHALFPQQAHMRYFQDVLARRGSWQGKGAHDDIFAVVAATGPRVATQLGVSAASLPIHYAANGLFDLQLSLSPTAWSYRHGILRAYGLSHTEHSADIEEHRAQAQAHHREKYSASKLAMLYQRHANIPYWLANSSAAESRFFWGWSRPAFHSAAKQIFELGADRLGSGEYGFHQIDAKQYDELGHALTDGVFASAAFLDSEQFAYGNPVARVGVAAALLGANQNWGVTVGNVHPNAQNTRWQQALPWPLYYAPALFRTLNDDNTSAPYVHLIDGGNTENLGVYSMLRRGAQMIVVADESVDKHGRMKDLCNVKNQVELIDNGHGGPRYWLAIPSLPELDRVCNQWLTHHYDAKSHQLGHEDDSANVEVIGKSKDILEGRRSLRITAKVLCTLRRGEWVIDRCRPKHWSQAEALKDEDDWLVGYPMHDWPEAWIAGCVLRLDDTTAKTVHALRDAPSCAESNGIRIHSRLALLKPAIKLKRWSGQFDLTSQPHAQPIRACWTAYEPPTTDEAHAYQPLGSQAWQGPSPNAYGCEAALNLKVNLPAKRDRCPAFPLHGVVSTTLDSSQYIYAAFKDLAHWQSAQLGADANTLKALWGDKLIAAKTNNAAWAEMSKTSSKDKDPLTPTILKTHDTNCATDLASIH